MNKPTKKLVTYSSLLLTALYAANKYIDSCITPITSSKNSFTFVWKEHQIQYIEKGDNKNPPLLLIHNLIPSSSKEEWYRIDDILSKDFHVYELDLLGCGNSDKPNITYINYMYVQIISAFINEVIKEKTNICAASFSSSIVLMTARFYPGIINKIVIINPTSIDKLVKPATYKNKIESNILELPIIGIFLYNCKMSKSSIEDYYKYICFYNDKNVSSKTLDIAYYNAHNQHSSGKFLLGSIIGKYTNINIIYALNKINHNLYLIGNGNYKSIIQEYKKYNKNIHAVYVSNCRLLPQLEIPETIADKIKRSLN